MALCDYLSIIYETEVTTMASSKQAAAAKKRTAQSSKTTNVKSSGAKGTRTTTSRPRSASARKKKKKVNSAAFNEAALFIALAVALILFISNFGLAGRVGIFFAALQFGTFGKIGRAHV